MKNLFLTLILCAGILQARADTMISDLPPATTPTGTDAIMVDQATNSASYTKMLLADLANFSRNGLTITTTTGTFTLTSGKTFTVTNTGTLTGSDGWSLNVGSGGTLGTSAYTDTYVLPTATTSVLGGVKIDGATIVITSGVISAQSQPWEYKNASFIGLQGHKYQVNTSGTIVTMTLSGTTDLGSIEVQDVALAFATHNFIVTTTGSATLNGTNTTYTDSVPGDELNCTLSATLGYWSIK